MTKQNKHSADPDLVIASEHACLEYSRHKPYKYMLYYSQARLHRQIAAECV